MLSSIIRRRVFPEKEQVPPMVWGAPKGMLNGVPGFLHAQLLKDVAEEHTNVIQNVWETGEALDAWKTQAREGGGERMARMLRGESVMVNPPYEVRHSEVLPRSDDPDD